MKEMTRLEGVRSEAAILVGVIRPDQRFHGEPLEEIEGLAETAGARPVGWLTQKREQPDRTTYLGKGKVDELQAYVQQVGDRLVTALGDTPYTFRFAVVDQYSPNAFASPANSLLPLASADSIQA